MVLFFTFTNVKLIFFVLQTEVDLHSGLAVVWESHPYVQSRPVFNMLLSVHFSETCQNMVFPTLLRAI